jgi:hypothetical protein
MSQTDFILQHVASKTPSANPARNIPPIAKCTNGCRFNPIKCLNRREGGLCEALPEAHGVDSDKATPKRP